MELTKNFEPGLSEEKWYRHWMDKGYFYSTPDHREPYTIVMPPPNVTGVLHMGHCLNNTIQDILIRRARMEGKNACWVPGTDHASIATEAKVVAMLRERGISKSSLSRDEFLAYAWEWKEKYGGIILQQQTGLQPRLEPNQLHHGSALLCFGGTGVCGPVPQRPDLSRQTDDPLGCESPHRPQ
jgi:valyl-tRNA synthetase